MTANHQFQKALLLLDQGQLFRGKQQLQETLALAEQERDEITYYSAACCLGELMLEQGDKEHALPLLKQVAHLEREDDVLGFEIKRAKELLSQSGS